MIRGMERVLYEEKLNRLGLEFRANTTKIEYDRGL